MKTILEISEDRKTFRVYTETDSQVESELPADMPAYGGTWVSRISEKGIAYVCCWRYKYGASWRYMKRHYKTPKTTSPGKTYEIKQIEESFYPE